MRDEGERRFRALAASVDVMVFITAPAGQMFWCNQAFKERTGFTSEDFDFPNPDNPFLHPDDAERVAAFLADLAASDDDRSGPIVNRFFDRWGRIHKLESFISKVQWEGNDAFQIVSRPVDATRSSDTSLETFRYLVESADDGILKLSVDGRFHFTNRGFQTIVGLDSVALGKRRFFDFVVAHDRGEVERALRGLDLLNPTARCEVRLTIQSGDEPRWVSIHTRLLPEEDEGGLILAFVRDVTEARRLEARTRQSQKLESLGLLAGGIAHDFNNLVTGILANTSVARKLAPPEGKLADVLRDLRHVGDRAAALTTSLLAYVGQRPADFRTLDLRQLVEDGVHLARMSLPEGPSSSVVADASPVTVRADAVQLTQVVLNLVTNAIQATDSTGSVVIEVGEVTVAHDERRGWVTSDRLDGRLARIRVRDSGSGMAPETMRKVFDPFYTTKGLGRGLGLSSVLGIVRGHGGVLAIESELGAGSAFEVLLPLSEMRPQPLVASDFRDLGFEPGQLLFVDDEPAIRGIAELILIDAGFEVVVKVDGESGLAAFTEGPDAFQAVVIDHSMPGMTGARVIRELRALRVDVPVVLTSGYREIATELPDVVFLPKPYDESGLLRAIQKAVSQTR